MEKICQLRNNLKTVKNKIFYAESGPIRLPNEIKILAITDTHGYIPESFQIIKNLNYDVCFLLGDLTQSDIDVLKPLLHLEKTYGVIGNHNYLNFLQDNDIQDIHGKVIEINGIKFTGWGGSIQYKKSIELGFDGFEGIDSHYFASQLPKADVLISHDGPRRDTLNTSHSGITGISEYIQLNNVKFNIHGHLHQNTKNKIGNCIDICIFRAALINETGISTIIG